MQIYLYLDILQIIYIYIVIFIANINFLQMEFKDRLKNLLDNVKIGGKRVTVYRIGKETPISMTSVNMYLKGSIPSYDKAKILADYFGVSVEWLMTGEENKSSSEVQIVDTNVMMVPLVNQYAHAGYMSGYADEEYVETLPKIPWIVDKEYKGRYISFEVKGDSMDDGLKHSYEQGDILLCREINPDYWKCKLHIHQWDAFVIVHKTEGIVVKQIIDHDVEKGIITVHSFNPIYEDYKIDLREVAQIFNVVKQQKNK